MSLRFEYPYDFERLWRHYPNQAGKFPAYKAFQKLKLSADDVDTLVAHVEKRCKEDLKWIGDHNGKKYIPMMATFLNQHRWEDDYPRAKKHWSQIIKEEAVEDLPIKRADPEHVQQMMRDLKRTLH